MTNDEEKEKIMQNKQKLKNIIADKIYISHDLTKNKIDMQKTIRNRAQEERKKMEKWWRLGLKLNKIKLKKINKY